MAKLNCILVEDELPAQDVLKSYIEKLEWLNVAGCFSDALKALDFLKQNEVDVIFLDIQMPKVSGLEFLKILKNPPQVIITTAFSNYAIEAFELDVRDYLMKPFSFDRFLKSINRLSHKPDPSQVHHLQSVTTEKSFAFFNVNKTMVRVHFGDVLYVESMREYVYIHISAGAKVVTKMKMSDMEDLLGSAFLRIHRSFIVNLVKVTAFNAEEIWLDKVSLPIGVNYKKLVESNLGQYTRQG